MSKLQGKEFIEEGFFSDYIKGLQQALELTKALKDELKKGVSASMKEVKIVTPESVKDIDNFNKAVGETNKKLTELEKLERKEKGLREEIKRLNTDEEYRKQVKEVERLRQEKLAFNKQTRDEIKASREVGNEYKKQSRLLNDLRNKYKDVALSQGENSKQAKQLLAQIKPLDAKLKQVDANVGQFQRNVGNYANAFRNLASSIGLTLGVAGAFRVLRGSIGVVKDFEKQVATTAGVLGKTREEISALSDDARRLGSITEFTASEVGSLQEAYARLGFTQEQILQTTESTLRGATAFQSELGATAELVGSTLNQFNLNASETQRVVDVLAKSTQISALNFQQLQTALPIVGKTAQVAGLSIEETAGLLGILSSNGIDASTSATGLRNIFLDLAKEGITLEDAFSQINGSTDKLSVATELFGKRGATVALTLAENTDKALVFEQALSLSAGTAEKLAKEQLNTLDGSLKLLNSAWEGYILQLNDATNGGNILTKGIKFLADNLETVLNVVGSLAVSFGIYKTAQIAFNNVMRATIALQRAYNLLLKANPIGVLITGLTTVVALLAKFNFSVGKSTNVLNTLKKQTFETEQATKDLNKAIADETAEMNSLFDILQDANSSTDLRNTAIRELNEKYKDYLPNLIDEKTSLKDISIFQEEANKALIRNIVLKQRQEALSNATSIQIQNEQEALKVFNDEVAKNNGNLNIANQVLKENINFYKEQLNEDYLGKLGNDYGIYSDALNKSSQEYNELALQAEKAGVSTETLLKAVSASISAYQDSKNSIVDINNLYDSYVEVFAKSNEVTKNNTKEVKENTKAKEENNKNTRKQIELETLKTDAIEESNSQTIEDTKKTNRVLIDLTEELNNKFQNKNNDRIEKQRQAYQALNNIGDAFAERERERSQERIENIDLELEKRRQIQNNLEQLAQAGNLSAQQSLAVEQQREAEARLKREQEIQKQKRTEASLALLKTYTASLENNATPQQAIAQVLNNGNLLAGLINALPSFDVGTDNTSKHIKGFNGGIDKKGGFLAINHPKEKVFNSKDSHKIGFDVPNSYVADTFSMYKKGLLVPKQALSVNTNWQTNDQILKKFDELKDEVKNIKGSSIAYDFDSIENTIIKVVKNNNLTERKHSKRSPLW